jgi:tetratricopeptide (TPR) repeat protein
MDRRIQADADFGTAWLVKSLALRQQGRLPQALAAGEQALTLTPSLAQARENLGFIQQRLNRPPVNTPDKPLN